MLMTEELPGVVGSTLFGADEQKIGTVADIYMDDSTMEPEWLLVKTGWFAGRQSFVPIAQAEWQGANLVVPYAKAEVKEAPTAEADGSLEPAEEETLYRHYGLERRLADQAPRQARTGADDAMTRSEEKLRVGTASQEMGRARLRKWVETEHVSQTIPVTHEEVRVVREPITQGNLDRATAGPALTENVHEVVLHEERPVVATETVPVERIRLEKRTVTEQAPVEADIRKERIEFEEDPPKRRQ